MDQVLPSQSQVKSATDFIVCRISLHFGLQSNLLIVGHFMYTTFKDAD